jgi:predicted permease
MAESGLLAWLGGTAGLLLGSGAARILAGTMRVPGDLPVRFDFSLDWRGAGYAVAAIAAAGLLMGLVSSAHALSGAAAPSLRRVGARSSGGQRTRRVLVAGQVAACVVLLVIAGLFVRSLGAAQDADLGFNPHGVLNVHMDVGQLGHTETEGRAFFDEAERRARSLPGVQAASFALTVPMGYVRVEETVESESQADGNPVTAGQNIVGAAYFEVMGIRLTRGRGFTGSDNEAAPPVAIVNQRLGDMLWPGEDPVGGRLRSSDAAAMSVQVVGVVETGRYGSLFEEPQPNFYRPMAQAYSGMRVLQVRTQMAPEALVPSIERTMRALEPILPLYDVQTMVQALGSGRGFFPLRVGASVAAALGIMGLSLAIVGVYGVVSYATVQRRRELGIRLAIGAAPRDVIGMVLRDGLTLLSLGIAIGLVAALACSRFVGSLLFGVGAHDAGTYAAVSAVLLCAGLAACLIPAWQAAAVDPKTALHSE